MECAAAGVESKRDAVALDLPKLQLFVRGRDGLQVFDGPCDALSENTAIANSSTGPAVYSKDGRLLAVSDAATGISILSTATGETILHIARPAVVAMAFSPKASFLLTWERFTTDAEQRKPNLFVWSLATGEPVGEYTQKKYSKEEWPSMQWTDDEVLCARCVSNEVHIFDGRAIAEGIKHKILLPNVASVSVAPGAAPYKFATFVEEKNTSPASVKIYQFPRLDSPVASKSFFKAQKVECLWNSLGTVLLVLAQTDVDKSNKSYYGESSLYYMAADGSNESLVPTKEGPIHDVKWNPKGTEFIVISGYIPATPVLFDATCRPIFDFGASHRNTICWSPLGRFVCICGFGNLAGDMDFWDRNKLKIINSVKADFTVSLEWAPDGRHVLTGVLHPRRRVDNGFRIWKYNGALVHSFTARELYEVAWKPSLPGIYPDRPQSPKPRGAAAAQPGVSAPVVEVKKIGAYRPPHASGALSELLRRERNPDSGPKKLTSKPEKPVQNFPPGYVETVAKNASRNKKRRQKKKDGTEEDDANEVEEAPAQVESKPTESKATAATATATVEDLSTLPQEELSKRIRNLNKKIRDIQKLQEQKSQGKEMNADQLSKLSTLGSLEAQLSELTIHVKST